MTYVFFIFILSFRIHWHLFESNLRAARQPVSGISTNPATIRSAIVHHCPPLQLGVEKARSQRSFRRFLAYIGHRYWFQHVSNIFSPLGGLEMTGRRPMLAQGENLQSDQSVLYLIDFGCCNPWIQQTIFTQHQTVLSQWPYYPRQPMYLFVSLRV